jgi:protein-tyrosine phosphatase
MKDYNGVPPLWREFLQSVIDNELKRGKKILAFCVGSHGRTGTFLASLIALLESSEEAPDPIAAVRERHCRKAVETGDQAEAIFALRGMEVPRKYQIEFGCGGQTRRR